MKFEMDEENDETLKQSGWICSRAAGRARACRSIL